MRSRHADEPGADDAARGSDVDDGVVMLDHDGYSPDDVVGGDGMGRSDQEGVNVVMTLCINPCDAP
jgi:hypothetical protein